MKQGVFLLMSIPVSWLTIELDGSQLNLFYRFRIFDIVGQHKLFQLVVEAEFVSSYSTSKNDVYPQIQKLAASTQISGGILETEAQ